MAPSKRKTDRSELDLELAKEKLHPELSAAIPSDHLHQSLYSERLVDGRALILAAFGGGYRGHLPARQAASVVANSIEAPRPATSLFNYVPTFARECDKLCSERRTTNGLRTRSKFQRIPAIFHERPILQLRILNNMHMTSIKTHTINEMHNETTISR